MVCIYRYIHICKYAWLYSTSGRDLRLNPHHFLQTQPGEMMDFSLRQWCEVLALGWWSHSAAHFFANLKGDCPSVGGCSSFRFDFDDFFHFFSPFQCMTQGSTVIGWKSPSVKPCWGSACHRPRYQLESTFAYGCHYNGGAFSSALNLENRHHELSHARRAFKENGW